MIIDLRGSSGSGKSFVVYSLLRDFPGEELWWPAGAFPNTNKHKEKLMGYRLPGDLFVMGTYRTAQCGGADTVKGGFPQYHAEFLHRAAMKFSHVVYESLMGSCAKVDHWVNIEERLKAENAPSLPLVHLTLDTPMETCRERVYKRRENAGRADKPFNEGATIGANWRRMRSLQAKMEAAGLDMRWVDHTRSYEVFRETLELGGWRP